MRYLSVCSGIEAATVAWHDLGWKPEAFSEIEKFPSQVLSHHYPEVPNLGDMTKYKEWNLNGTIDILVGGTPCQSFSVAGLRKGLEDPRGNLMLTYLGIADKFKPKWIVWENVPGVLSSNGGRDFGSFLGALVELGYGFAYRVLDAQNFGVAQRRRRVFVVGCLGDWRSAAEVLFEPESLRGDIKKGRKKGKGTATSFAPSTCGTLLARDYKGLNSFSDIESGKAVLTTVGALCARDYKGVGNQYVNEGKCIVYENHPADSRVTEMGETCSTVAARWGTGGGNVPIATTYGIPGNWIGRKPENGGNAVEPMHNIAPCLTSTDKHGVSYGFLPTQGSKAGNIGYVEEQAPTLRAGCDAYGLHTYSPQAIGHIVENDVAGCITKNSGGGGETQNPAFVVQPTVWDTTNITSPQNGSNPQPGDPCFTLAQGQHPPLLTSMAVRRLTPVECERLQGFPDGYTDIKEKCPDGPRYKALGNSMAVPVMAWIGKRIQRLEEI